jgi:hypothetical protein
MRGGVRQRALRDRSRSPRRLQTPLLHSQHLLKDRGAASGKDLGCWQGQPHLELDQSMVLLMHLGQDVLMLLWT